MTIAEAKAKYDEAFEFLLEKQQACFHARLKEQKSGRAYEKALEETPGLDAKSRHKLCGDWYEAERQAENALFEARQAEAAVEKANEQLLAAQAAAHHGQQE
ncbi:MAG: hypothetical protein ACJ8C4_15130 [Gemmataceae bacterium]